VTEKAQAKPSAPLSPRDALARFPKPGLFASSTEKRFYSGVQAYFKEDYKTALAEFEAASSSDSRNISDDLFAGVVATKLDEFEKAVTYLERVAQSDITLPDELMKKLLPTSLLTMALQINITPMISATVAFDSVGAVLMLAEVYQHLGRLQEATSLLDELHQEHPGDALLSLSLCELGFELGEFATVVEIAAPFANESEVHTAILHYKAKALVQQGLLDVGLEELGGCLKRTSGRSPDLLKAIRYDKADVLERKGQASRARRDWEKLYAEDRGYADVKVRLGM
jgi:tetratricopeptide (TPR) repeat protein